MKYRVTGVVTISVYTVVEAESAEEAKEKAGEAGNRSFCYQCSQVGEDEWNAAEIDGEVAIVSVDEA